jgi:hypothetical protein
MKKLLAILAGFCLTLMSLHGAPACFAQADQGLKERAQAFWDARGRQDWTVLYQYQPGADRSQAGLDEFTAFSKKNAPFRFLSFELEHTETAGDLGWVKVACTARVAGYGDLPPKTTSETWQVWEKIEGNWFPVPAKQLEELPSRPPSVRSAEDEAALTKRANDFWEAKEKEQWGLLYEYCDPEFRKTVSQEEFLQKKARYVYVAHSVVWTEVTGDKGKVKVTSLIRPNDPYLTKIEPKEDSSFEDWIKVEGIWYRSIPKSSFQGG